MTTHRLAVLTPYVANLLLVQLDQAGWRSPQQRRAVELLRTRGHAVLAGEVESGFAQLRASAGEWRDRVGPISDDGNAETPVTEIGAPSGHDEITTNQAASMLGLTARRVAQLIGQEAIAARKVGRLWLVDRRSVVDLLEIRRSA